MIVRSLPLLAVLLLPGLLAPAWGQTVLSPLTLTQDAIAAGGLLGQRLHAQRPPPTPPAVGPVLRPARAATPPGRHSRHMGHGPGVGDRNGRQSAGRTRSRDGLPRPGDLAVWRGPRGGPTAGDGPHGGRCRAAAPPGGTIATIARRERP